MNLWFLPFQSRIPSQQDRESNYKPSPRNRLSSPLVIRCLAKAQTSCLPAEQVAAGIVAEISGEILKLKERIAAADAEIEERFRVHSMAKLLTSLPGMGTRLGAEFLVTVGDPRAKFTGADQLASFAGLAPATRDSGKRTGNNRRMRGYLHTSSVRIPAAVHVDHLARDIGGAIT